MKQPESRPQATLRWVLRSAVLACLLAFGVHADTTQTIDWPIAKQLRGKVVLIDFWASWCAPCRKSLPWMDGLQKQYRDAGLVVLAVNLDKDRALAQAFLAATPVDLRIEYDPNGQLAEALKVQVMPTSLLIDRSGEIRQRHPGFRAAQRAEREQQIAQLLKEPVS